MALEWKEEYVSGFPEIDLKHKEIFHRLSDLGMNILQGRSSPVLLSDLARLRKVLIAHHVEENKLLELYHCHPGLREQHITDHNDFVHRLDMVIQDSVSIDEARAFLRYASFWVRYHVLAIDKTIFTHMKLVKDGCSESEANKGAFFAYREIAPILLDNISQTHAELYETQLNLAKQNYNLRLVQHELQRNNIELEARVKERTNELSEANDKLQDEYLKLQEMNLKLENTQGQLLQSDKMAAIGQLAAGVAHEINNPVGFVNANLGTLKNYLGSLLSLISQYEQVADELPDSIRKHVASEAKDMDLDYIRQDVMDLLSESMDGLDRVKQIVQDLKDFARAGEAIWQDADLHRGIDSTLNVVWNELKYKAQINKEYGKLPLVRCVPAQLNQVFMNILVNAAHAIETSGTITIRTGTQDENVWISITDTGKGMSQEVLKRVFEPFFTTKPLGKGTGLGLSLAYGIIQKHKGTIEVKSEEGVGSTFTIRLPIHGVEGAEEGAVSTSASSIT